MIKAERYTNSALSMQSKELLFQDLSDDRLRYAAAQRLKTEVLSGRITTAELDPYRKEICKLLVAPYKDTNKTIVALSLLIPEAKENYLVKISLNKDAEKFLRIGANFERRIPNTTLAKQFQKNYQSLLKQERIELLEGLLKRPELIDKNFFYTAIAYEKDAELRTEIVKLIKDHKTVLEIAIGEFKMHGQYSAGLFTEIDKCYLSSEKVPENFVKWLKQAKISSNQIETIHACDSILAAREEKVDDVQKICSLQLPTLHVKKPFVKADLTRRFITDFEKIYNNREQSNLKFNQDASEKFIQLKDSVKLDGVIVFAKVPLVLKEVDVECLYHDPNGKFKYCYFVSKKIDVTEKNIPQVPDSGADQKDEKFFQTLTEKVVNEMFVGDSKVYNINFRGVQNKCIIFDVDRKSYIIRFSKENTLENERKNMQLAYEAGVPVPTIFKEGKIGEHYFQVQEFLPGKTLTKSTKQKFGQYYELGKILAKLHSVEVSVDDKLIDLKRSFQRQLASDFPIVKNAIKDLDISPEKLMSLVDTCEKSSPVLVHRDLHQSNIILSPDDKLTLIDWGLSGFTEYPLVDLSRAVPSDDFAREQLLAGYNSSNPNLKRELTIFSLFRQVQVMAIRLEKNENVDVVKQEIRDALDFIKRTPSV